MLVSNYLEVLKSLNSTTKLIAVSKYKSVEEIQTLYSIGQRDFGENRVQELLEKFEKLPLDIRWHFIGKLQSNKVKFLVNKVHLIHSLDSSSLALEIEKQFSKANVIANCLIQVNIGKDENKSGIDVEELSSLIKLIEQCPHIQVLGFMTILPIVSPSETLSLFSDMQQLFQYYQAEEKRGNLPKNLSIQELSMGMSEDFLDAERCGATMVRVGSKIFGNR